MNQILIRLEPEMGAKVAAIMKERRWKGQAFGMAMLECYLGLMDTSDNKKPAGTGVAVAGKKKPQTKRFAKPSQDEVAREFEVKGSLTCLDDADTFFNHYESNGWKVGKNGMKNWKATVAQWHKRNQEGNNHGKNKPTKVSDLDLDAIDY